MKVWKVGGAVRDALLGRPITDVDWVVTGREGVRARNDYALPGAVAPAIARGPAGSLIVVSWAGLISRRGFIRGARSRRRASAVANRGTGGRGMR